MKDSTKNSIRFITLSGLFIALGIVLPIAFHAFPDGGKMFLPMFLPIVLGAMFLPWQYALAVGIITPLLSSVLTGMPPMLAPLPMAIMMAAELGVVAVLISIMKNIKWIKEKDYRIIFILIPALLIGFAVSGAALWVAIQFFGVKGPGIITYVIGAIITGLPGIAAQLVLVPLIYSLLKARLIQA